MPSLPIPGFRRMVTVRSRGRVMGIICALTTALLAATALGTPQPSEAVEGDTPQAPPRTAAEAYGWGVAGWGDEFTGTRLSPGWTAYDSPGHAGNGIRSPRQITVANGVMTQSGTADATSAGMVLDSQFHRYGRWETRLRTTQLGGSGHPYHAVTALIPGGEQDYHCGATDVDYAEYDIGGPVYFFAHNLPNVQDYTSIRLNSTQWHTYAVEITPDHMSWFIDGQVVMTDTRRSIVSGVALAPNFQLDAYHPRGLKPATLQVDWTRYYPLRGSTAPIPAPAPERGTYDDAC